MEILLRLERKEILTRATLCMNLEDIMLHNITQSQKDIYNMISLIWGQIQRQKSRIVVPRSYKYGEIGRCPLMGTEVSGLQDEKSSVDWLHNNVNVLNSNELYTFIWLRW